MARFDKKQTFRYVENPASAGFMYFLDRPEHDIPGRIGNVSDAATPDIPHPVLYFCNRTALVFYRTPVTGKSMLKPDLLIYMVADSNQPRLKPGA